MSKIDHDNNLTQYAQIATSTWADALDSLGINGVMRGIEQRSGAGRFAAYATTARHIVAAQGDFEPADFAVGKLVAATGPGRALLIDVAGAPISTFGGIASMAAAQRNASAVIIDGACRDVDEIQASGLWLASRHVAPTTGKTRLCLREMGGLVTIGGIQVEQDDLVVGDETGVVVIPQRHIRAMLCLAQAHQRTDEQVEQSIRAGMSFAQAAAAANYIPEKA